MLSANGRRMLTLQLPGLWPALLLALVAAGSGAAQGAGSPSCADVVSLAVPAMTGGGLAEGAHTFVADGVRFWYCVGGRKVVDQAPAVFVHGGPGQGSQHFAALTGPTLESALQIVYFDQRGSGRSERPWTKEYGVSTLVDDLERLREALGVARMSLIAHSFGGLLALEYAAAYPQRVEHLVIVSGLSDVPATTQNVCDRLAESDPAAHDRAMAQPLPSGQCNPFAAYSGREREAYDRRAMFPDPAVAETLAAVDTLGGLRNTGELSRALFSNTDVFNLRFNNHERVRVPVLVVAGERDHQIGLEPQQDLAERLPNGQLIVIDDAGHFPHLDAPKRFADSVVEFLQSDEGQGQS